MVLVPQMALGRETYSTSWILAEYGLKSQYFLFITIERYLKSYTYSIYIVGIRHGVKPFQKGLSPSPRPYQKGLSPSPFSKPFLKKGLSPSSSP